MSTPRLPNNQCHNKLPPHNYHNSKQTQMQKTILQHPNPPPNPNPLPQIEPARPRISATTPQSKSTIITKITHNNNPKKKNHHHKQPLTHYIHFSKSIPKNKNKNKKKKKKKQQQQQQHTH